MPETYDEEAVQQILRLAMIKQGQDGPLLRSQLVEIAEELGISESSLAAAEEEWQVQTEEQQARQEFAVYRHHQLRQGIVRFIIINSFLVMLNVISTHRIDWSVYPVVIWGMAIALQAWQVMQCEGENYDRAFRRWRLRQQIGQSFKAISERFKLSWARGNTRNIQFTQNASSAEASSSTNGGLSNGNSNGKHSSQASTSVTGVGSVTSGNDSSDQPSPDATIRDQARADSKSRLQNRMGINDSAPRNRLSHHNRLGNSSNGLPKDRDPDSADHLPG